VILTDKTLQPVVEFYQLLPAGMFRKQSPTRLVEPFIMALFGAIDIRAPGQCGLIKNIGYTGGF